MSVRVRKNVYSLPHDDETLLWYGRAVNEMWQRPVSDPTSWRFMGAVHGNPNFQLPPGANGFWDQCQHQTWFFLPWHRGYLTAFEAMVAQTVEELGGPVDWALPYWNYSEDPAVNPNALLIPPAFRNATLDDGSPNPLHAPRSATPDGDVGLRISDVSLSALNEDSFTGTSSFLPGFGGTKTGFSHFGQVNGRLESVPHNVVHVRVNGWMINPNTAAFDPIFWLHHCNIDRLWEEWRANDSSHTNPNDIDWLTNIVFAMHDGDGIPFNFISTDVVNTTQFMHGYRYDNIEPPSDSIVVAGGIVEMAASTFTPEPELAGASEAAVQLGDEETRVPVKMQPEGVGKSFTESALPTPMHVYVRLENVTGSGLPGDYDVMIDLEDDDQPPYSVGILSTFGIAQASDPDGSHGGAGIEHVYDITQAAERLGLTTQSAPKLIVSFRKVKQRVVLETTHPALEELALPETTQSSVKVGRIGVYFD